MPGGGFENQLVNEIRTARTVAPTPNFIPGTQVVSTGNPITDAANIQVNSLQEAIPFFQPFLDAGSAGLEAITQGSTVGGLSQRIDEILNGSFFQGLVDERTRSVEGALAAGGLTRSGEAVEQAAAIPTDLAFQIENLLGGRQGALADTGFAGASQIGSLTTRIGEAIASGILGNEERNASNDANRDNNRSQLLGAVLGGVFSDPTLKQDIQKVGQVGPLGMYNWNWIPESKGTIVEGMPNTGFLSTEVREHYPQFVNEFGGFDVIDYSGLINHLEETCH